LLCDNVEERKDLDRKYVLQYTTCNKTVSDITYLPGTSRLTKLSTFAVDLSCFSVWDSRTTRTEIYPGKTAERTGTGSEPEGTEK